MANRSIFYEVPKMSLIAQDKNMACWYASALMLINWRERQNPTLRCKALDDTTINLYKANNGIQNNQIIPLAKRLGFLSVPPMSPTIDALEDWLKIYGPLWTNGVRHIVVVAGIKGPIPIAGNSMNYQVKVYDPWPGNGITWRNLDGWYTGTNPRGFGNSARDAGPGVEATFLHCPAKALSGRTF